jgi:hypothetical protein
MASLLDGTHRVLYEVYISGRGSSHHNKEYSMNIRKKPAGTTQIHWKLSLALLAAILIVQQASAQGTNNVPKQYYQDDDSMSPSAACKTLFPGGLGVPTSTVLPHEYVLLFVFDNDTDSEIAGKNVFHADPKIAGSLRNTVGCIADPDPATDTSGKVLNNWGIEVKGGCPTDCTGPHLFNLTKDLSHKNPKVTPVPDPLKELSGNIHWGIFLLPLDNDATSDVKVWQVRAKDALHAGRILSSLGNLNGMKGYLGHLLIGHRPIIDQVQAVKHK